MLNLSQIKDSIRADIDAKFKFVETHEQAIPDSATVLRDASGKIKTYIAYRFGDLQRMYGGSRGLTGVRNDSYELPIYFEAVSGVAKTASRTADLVIEEMLGAKFKYTGEIRKRPGGAMYPITSTNAATEAYMFPTSYAVTIQLMDVS